MLAVSASLCFAACGGDDGATATTTTRAGWWNRAVAYELFVRSFADSDGDGVGDLKGLTSKLDYINDGAPGGDDLGADLVWLMPIYPSPSYHGYDVTELKAIRAEYGDMADFEALIQAAKARGIRIILDLPLNHSSDQHPWFKSARSGPDAEYRDHYLWRDSAPSPSWPAPWGGHTGPLWHPAGGNYYYGVFNGMLPDYNLDNPKVREELLGAMRFWLDKEVAGFRVDAARFLFEGGPGKTADQPKTHAFIQGLKAELLPQYPELLLVAEAWGDAKAVSTYHAGGAEYDLAFSFDLSTAIRDALKKHRPYPVRETWGDMVRAFSDLGFNAPILSNHDMRRLAYATKTPAAAKLAAATLFAAPGTPFIYYGDELGLEGGTSLDDEDKRTPMVWTAAAPGHGFTIGSAPWRPFGADDGARSVAAQLADPASLLSCYRALVQLRRDEASLGSPGAKRLTVDGDAVLAVAYPKTAAGQLVFAANFSLAAQSPQLPLTGAAATPRYASEGATAAVEGGQPKLSLPPQGFIFFTLR